MFNVYVLTRIAVLLLFCALLLMLGVYDMLYALRLQKTTSTFTMRLPRYTTLLVKIELCFTLISFLLTLWIFFQVA